MGEPVSAEQRPLWVRMREAAAVLAEADAAIHASSEGGWTSAGLIDVAFEFEQKAAATEALIEPMAALIAKVELPSLPFDHVSPRGREVYRAMARALLKQYDIQPKESGR